MLISRTPLRITLGGGGSDLGQGGTCINMAINLHVYVAINHIYDPEYSLKYSLVERVDQRDDIQHPIIRNTLNMFDTPPGIEIVTMSDVPSDSGLGSSGAFTVGLLRALHPTMSQRDISYNACVLDTGMQDQHAATYGGLNLWRFGNNSRRDIVKQRTPLDVPPWFFGLALYDTGLRRNAYRTLRSNARPDEQTLIQQAHNMRAALSDPTKFADCLNEQWATKLAAAPTPIHGYIDHLIRDLKRDGAWGAKLVGAGDGGFILVFSQQEVPSPLRRIPIQVDMEGTRLI